MGKKKGSEQYIIIALILLLIGVVYYGFTGGFGAQSIVNNYDIDNTTTNSDNSNEQETTQPGDSSIDTQPDTPIDEPVFDWSDLFVPLNLNTCDDLATQIGFVWYPNAYNAAGGTYEDCTIERGACKLYPPKGFVGNIDNLFCCSYDKMCYESWELA